MSGPSSRNVACFHVAAAPSINRKHASLVSSSVHLFMVRSISTWLSQSSALKSPVEAPQRGTLLVVCESRAARMDGPYACMAWTCWSRAMALAFSAANLVVV